jgi:arylsulfatase A-like enzyme
LDTLRADCIQSNPHKLYPRDYDVKVELQHSKLDELCSTGCFFPNTISVAPYTSASHAAYFTGKWPKNNGLFDQFNSKLDSKNIFEIAREKGFRTVFKTDFPFVLGKYLNMTNGVDKYIIENNEEALEEIAKNDKVFAFVHFGQIHYPYGFHNVGFGKDDYREKVSSLLKKYGISVEDVNLTDMAIETFRTKEDLDLLYKYKKIIAELYTKKLDSDLFNLYLEGINYFHQKLFNGFIEGIMDSVKDDNYLIIISSDHGEAWNDGCYGHHNSLDEGVIRVPLLFLSQDIKPRVFQNRVRTIDVVPTLDEMLFQSAEIFDGQSLNQIISQGITEEDRDAFAAVWVNESHDVLKKIKTLLATDEIQTSEGISVKYAVTSYRGQYKYSLHYKEFVNRTSNIEDSQTEGLWLIRNLTDFEQVFDEKIMAQMRSFAEKLNSVKQGSGLKKNDEMREYFRLMGYKI